MVILSSRDHRHDAFEFETRFALDKSKCEHKLNRQEEAVDL